MTNWLKDIELSGKFVTLIPMQKSHRNSLVEAASDGKLWELWFTSVPSEQTVDNYIDFALSEKELGRSLPFVVVENETNKIIGSTRFCNAEPEHKRLEIGYTFYSQSYQRTPVNTECKLLLLSHAFEKLGAIAVEFRTHFFNEASRKAISRLGAKQDGILRNHRLDSDGTIRDTVVFSILQNEWKVVKKSLEFKLSRTK
ncbi:MAG: N-acetyltransferase [Calditrichaeota bacterium]|nr:MAG: N-acetyltransferase [Calditrichota bacterium]